MKVAFFTLTPDSGMYGSFIDIMVAEGNEVTVITPSGGKSKISVRNGSRRLEFKSMPLQNVGLIKKGIASLLFPYYCYAATKKFLKNEKFDIILVSTPPIGYNKPVKLLKKWNPAAFFYLILRDIYPDCTRFVGMHKILPAWALFRNMEKKMYKTADIIGCMSPANVEFILKRNDYLDEKKAVVLPNWEKANESAGYSEEIRKKYGLGDKFVVLYGGNIGIPQNLELLLKLAKEKSGLKDVLFILAGRGTHKEMLIKQAQDMGLDNVRFLDFIPRDEFDLLQASCNVGYISLHPDFPTPNIPSKYMGYYGVKLPILAVLDPVTDFGEYIIDSCNGGLWSLATDFEKLSRNFDIMYHDRKLCKRMGESGYKYIQEFTPEKTYTLILEQYRKCTGNSAKER